jgi:hypothetical protein
MNPFPLHGLSARLRRRGIPARVSSLVMVFQKSPLLPLLPQARLLSSAGATEALKWTIAAIAGLGSYDSVSGASQVTQLQPTPGSLTVNAVAGDPLNFVFQTTGTPHIPYGHQTTDLPPGLVLTGLLDSTVDSITGTPAVAGTYPVTITAWELPVYTGDTFSQDFTFVIVNPPLPEITQPPAGGVFAPGRFVSLSVGHNHGRKFTWRRDGSDLGQSENVFFSRDAPRKYRPAPPTDPGSAWRSGDPFVESTDSGSQTDPAWTAVSGGIGFDTNTVTGGNFLPFIATAGGNTQALMFGTTNPPKVNSIHLRMPFTISSPEVLSYLKLRVQCDDGFVAWLNGTEIASQNKPDPLTWNGAATADAASLVAVTFREIDLSQYLSVLRQGDNLLAVQAMNRSTTSPDFLFNCELAGGINSTNSANLVVTSLESSIAGNYSVKVENPAGSVTSDPFPVLVIPSILAQPEPLTIENGSTAVFSVTAAGSPPLSYQWYRGTSGDTSSPVAGATGESVTTPALTATATYWVKVTSPYGNADSDSATVTVNPASDPYAEWKAAKFSVEQSGNSSISGPAADPDGDGLSNEQEYIFGTPPLVAEFAPSPEISVNGNQIKVMFTAQKAAGPGYAVRNRHYAVETTVDAGEGPWAPLPEAADITGNDQTVTVVLPGTSSRSYCRLKVWLKP